MPNSFDILVGKKGNSVTVHRESNVSKVPCPCRTPEGYRDPEWHVAHPLEPVCNAQGFLISGSAIVDIFTKAFMQPVGTGRFARGMDNTLIAAFGQIEVDDHIGMFPLNGTLDGAVIDFADWSLSGSDYIVYNGMNFIVVGANLIPDPSNTELMHHWEVACRRSS